ncbi:MAG TPA: FtsK/SpoIIIE domain-containing protein [Dactylosporangium sp.]|nr:FtsK/SpoIIIE domain-containing protein [Dactylosporangium sp.]
MTATASDLYNWADDDDMGQLIEGRFPQHDDDDEQPLQDIDVRAFQRARVPGVMAPPAAVVLEQPAAPTPAAPRRVRRAAGLIKHPAARVAYRQAVYVAAGVRAGREQRRDARGTARHERMMRAAELKGDHAAVQEWMRLADEHRQARHERRMAMRTHPVHVARKTIVYTGLTVAGLLTLGIALAVTGHGGAREVWAPLLEAFRVIRYAIDVVAVVWRPALLATPAFVVAAWWARGRSRAVVPAWMMSAAQLERQAGEPITPSSLVTALRELGLPKLTASIKTMEDAGAALLGPVQSAGCGIEVDVFLPQGTSTIEVQAKRQKLAENLGRHKHELFITIPERPRTVRLWVADSGALDEPIGPSPLVTDPSIKANYRTGRAPWGQSLRGEPSTVSLFQRHILVAGISNQGKTASLRALILWLALDPRVRIWLADFKGVGDWGMFRGIAEVLIEGPTDEHVIAGTHMAEAGVTEMQKRTTLMQELTAKGWTQEKILADPRFAPLVLVFDEAQKGYGCGAVGDDKRPYGGKGATSRYFQAIKAIHDQGRAVNVTTAEGVQDPTNENLPVRTREGNHIRCSLVVGTAAQGVMALGENAVNAGAAPHELRQGADKGTVVVAGDITAFDMPRGQVFTTIRTHYIGADDARAIAERAKAKRRGTVTTDGGDDGGESIPADVLADVIEIFAGERRIRSEEVVHRLKSLRPEYYREWTTTELTAALKPHGAEPYKTSGTMHVSLARVTDAMADRDAAAESDAESA